jgi:hypothetical protein
MSIGDFIAIGTPPVLPAAVTDLCRKSLKNLLPAHTSHMSGDIDQRAHHKVLFDGTPRNTPIFISPVDGHLEFLREFTSLNNCKANDVCCE